MNNTRHQLNKNELWIHWLTRSFNSYEAFEELAFGKNPKNVAEKFLTINKNKISEVFEKCDEDDKDTLEQFQKLAECEWHIFRILKKQLESRNNVINLDFKAKKIK